MTSTCMATPHLGFLFELKLRIEQSKLHLLRAAAFGDDINLKACQHEGGYFSLYLQQCINCPTPTSAWLSRADAVSVPRLGSTVKCSSRSRRLDFKRMGADTATAERPGPSQDIARGD